MSRIQEEIAEQPEALNRVTKKFIESQLIVDEVVKKVRSGKFSHILLTGMGASYYSCYPLWLKLSNQGLPVSLWETSELINFAPNCIRNDTLLIVVSQSGESAEIKRLLALENAPAYRIGITNSPSNHLAQRSDLVLELCAGEETSVSTKTYLASLAILHLLGCKIIGESLEIEIGKLHAIADKIRETLRSQMDQIEEMTHFLGSAREIAVLGRGYSLASANYGALFFKEGSRTAVIGLSAAQFRHGPMEIVNPDFCAIVFAGCRNVSEMNKQLAADIVSLGGKVIVFAPEPAGRSTGSMIESELPAVDGELLPLLEIIPLQRLAVALASSRGFEAGIFRNSGKVTLME